MKYPIDTKVTINNRVWIVAEFRLGRGREWIYTLANERNDGTFDTIRLNERAIGKITYKESKEEIAFEVAGEVYA